MSEFSRAIVKAIMEDNFAKAQDIADKALSEVLSIKLEEHKKVVGKELFVEDSGDDEDEDEDNDTEEMAEGGFPNFRQGTEDGPPAIAGDGDDKDDDEDSDDDSDDDDDDKDSDDDSDDDDKDSDDDKDDDEKDDDEKDDKKPPFNKDDDKKDVKESYIGFDKLKGKLATKGVSNPGAVAASIGMKKYGKKRFEKAAHEGKKITSVKEGIAIALKRAGRLNEAD